jgi:hypothetical protein
MFMVIKKTYAVKLKLSLAAAGLVVLTALISTASIGCKKEVVQTPQVPQAQQQIPPEKVGPPTIVPKGVTADKYVSQYYTAYKNQKWSEAYKMLPAINKAKEAEESFTSVRKTMPITDFKISPVRVQGDTQVVEATYSLGAQGSWMIVWSFKKTKDGLVAEGYQAQMGK